MKTPTPHAATFEEAIAAVASEREYQDSLWQDQATGGDNPLTIGETILLIEEYAARARKDWTGQKAPETNALDGIRKLAGIAVHALQQWGAPQREGFPRVAYVHVVRTDNVTR